MPTIAEARALLRAAQVAFAKARSAVVAGAPAAVVPTRIEPGARGQGRGASAAGTSAPSAAAAVVKARTAVAAASDNLKQVLGSFLGDDPVADVARLDARYPIALFPVRIETRFDQESELLIRVYPDEILADAHDPALTTQEKEMGDRFWTESGTLGAASAWQHLLGLYSATRAAWI